MGAPKTRKVVKKNETDDPTVGKVGEVGKLVKRIEMGGPQARQLMRKVETGGQESRRIGEGDPDE